MFQLKYDGHIKGPAAWHMAPSEAADVDFRLERLNPTTALGRYLKPVQDTVVKGIMWLAPLFVSHLKIGRLLVLFRDADCRAVLGDAERFPVHYDPDMRELATGGGETFMLADDGDEHRLKRDKLRPLAQQFEDRAIERTMVAARELLRASNGQIDAMKDYFTRASAEAAVAYLGLVVADIDRFAEYTMAMSAVLFADPFGKPVTRELASHAAWHMRGIAKCAIDRARRKESTGLVAEMRAHDFSDDEMSAIILGLTTALIPTISLAAGKILVYFLGNKTAWQQAVNAAVAADAQVPGADMALQHLLVEAARLAPALNPGQFRYAPNDTRLRRRGRGGSLDIPANTVILAATAAALRDPDRCSHAGEFDTDHCPMLHGGLMFGAGDHVCMGRSLALRQLTVLFRELLSRPGLQATGAKRESAGPFPRRLDMTFPNPASLGPPTMVKIAVPCPHLDQASAAAVRDLIAPLDPEIYERHRESLTEVTGIHFVALDLLDVGSPRESRYILLLEINGDGTVEEIVGRVCTAADAWLCKVLTAGSIAAPPSEVLADFLLAHRIKIRSWPWGTTGLDYNGSREFDVATKDRQARLASFAGSAVDLFQRHTGGGNRRPMATLAFVRQIIRGDASGLTGALQLAAEELIEKNQAATDPLITPSRQRLLFADWVESTDIVKALRTLTAPDVGYPLLAGLLVTMVFIVMVDHAAGTTPGSFHLANAGIWIAWLGITMVWSVVTFAVTLLAVAGIGFAVLRSHEMADRPDNREPDNAAMAEIAQRENLPNTAQNHFLSVSDLKPGLFRRLTFAFALWSIGLYVRFWGRPGFIVDMGTIHFAGWFRLPGSSKMIFHANYDGSWESYLEDFITKANIGQTAAWSNAIGFPRTAGLIGGGAADGDQFKRWVRRQQRPTQFWYSRLPRLTLDRVRTNALIYHGLAQARSETDAAAWLACFNAQLPLPTTVEYDEVQSIVFSSLPSHPHGACLLVTIPEIRTTLVADLLAGSNDLPQLQFGEITEPERLPCSISYIAFGSEALVRLGVPGLGEADGLAGFGYAFTAGMSARARILGDAGPADPAKWRWSDRDFTSGGAGQTGAMAAVWIFSREAAARDAAIVKAEDYFSTDLRYTIRTDPVGATDRNRLGVGHFGFSDGIAQPVIDACFGAAAAPARDRLKPGEILFGYPNNQGHFAPSPRLRCELDPQGLLRDQLRTADDSPNLPPQFRDFGRNGTFLVLREIEQDVTTFNDGIKAQGRAVSKDYPWLAATTGCANEDDWAEWVGAKMIGRRRDGRPLIERADKADDQRVDPNDFSYATSDPTGLICPLGAHIRRANPRDSLLPSEANALTTTNRHRIIRRGRSYVRKTGEAVETGLLFAAVCGDLERQFEFVQQTWISSTHFHGMTGEADPLLTVPDGLGTFTIPTVGGPVKLAGLNSSTTVRGGGYFFVPSRAALSFLAQSGDTANQPPLTAEEPSKLRKAALGTFEATE